MSKPNFFEPTMKEDINALSSCIKKESVNAIDVVGMTALHWGALFGKEKSVTFLLNNNADAKIKDKDGIRPYDWARNQNHKKISDMIKLKMEADQMGWPILNWIAKKGKYKLISSFANEINVNLVDKDFGRASIHWSVYSAKINKNTKTLEQILESDYVYLDLKDRSDGRTPLCMAAYLDDIESIRLLLSSNPGLDIKDKNPGYSPIMWAIYQKNYKIVKMLIAAGASIFLTNQSGDNVLTMAKKSKINEIIETIEYCLQFEQSIKQYMKMLFKVKDQEQNAVESWHESTKQYQDNPFYRLPPIIQNYFNKAFLRIMKGPSLYSHNIFDKNNKVQSLTKPIQKTLPAELLNNEEILIKRLKSELNKLF